MSTGPLSVYPVFLVAAEVEAVLEQRLGVASELPKERCDVAVMSAFVQEQMDDQLTPAVSDGVAVDVNHAWFAEFGVGPCIEMGPERVAGPAPVGVYLRPGHEVVGREGWHGLAFEGDDCRDPAFVGEDDVREAVAEGGPS